MLGHSAGAGALVVDVAQVLQARRRLDVLRAAHAVHGIHLGAIGAQGRGVKAEHGRRRRGGSGEEVRARGAQLSHDTRPPSSFYPLIYFLPLDAVSEPFTPHPHTVTHTCFIVKVSQCEVTCFCGRGGGLSYRFFLCVCVFLFNRLLTEGFTGAVTCEGRGQF